MTRLLASTTSVFLLAIPMEIFATTPPGGSPSGCGGPLVSLFPFEDPRSTFETRHLLGRGHGNQTWLLQSDGAWVAEKIYERREIWQIEVDAFDGLAWLVGRDGVTGFDLPKGLTTKLPGTRGRPKPLGYRIDYYPGRTVMDIVGGDADPRVRSQVRRNYLDALERVKAMACGRVDLPRDMTWDEGLQLPWLWFEIPRQTLGNSSVRTRIHVTFKPDNVIVDPWTLKMTIIDAY